MLIIDFLPTFIFLKHFSNAYISAMQNYTIDASIYIKFLSAFKSYKSYFCYLMQMPKKVLNYGYALYNIYIKTYKRRLSSTKYSYYLSSYILYALPHRVSNFQFMPPSAGIYILSIDGGGIRGVISFIFLIYIKQALSNFRCLLREHFNFIYGTSTGGITAIGIGFLGFKDIVSKTFKRRKFRSTLLTSQYSLTAIELGFKAAFKSHLKMFNPLINNTRVIPCLFCNYNKGKRPKEIGYSLIQANYSQHNISISEAFFKPKVVKNLGTF
ncbi:hypothetical protein V2W45_1475017 [Cenococcum geophilum]